ncbi:MAG TPA: hypothetical protein ENJ56_01290 [Anaerolineae bacterium]|nr:hypothetical protein [Anaerolineae bacterium]
MTNYIFLYSGGSGMPETEEAQAAVMAAWGAWYGGMGEAVVDGGNPFSGVAKTVASDGTISDGAAFAGSGYTIVSAESADAAATMAQGCPVLQGGGTVSVFEIYAL